MPEMRDCADKVSKRLSVRQECFLDDDQNRT